MTDKTQPVTDGPAPLVLLSNFIDVTAQRIAVIGIVGASAAKATKPG